MGLAPPALWGKPHPTAHGPSGQIIQEANLASGFVSEYFHGPDGQLIARHDQTANGPRTVYACSDPEGSVVAVADGQGTVLAEYVYWPTGLSRAYVRNPAGAELDWTRLWHGQRLSPEDGMYNRGGKLYDPFSGTTASPADGAASRVADPNADQQNLPDTWWSYYGEEFWATGGRRVDQVSHVLGHIGSALRWAGDSLIDATGGDAFGQRWGGELYFWAGLFETADAIVHPLTAIQGLLTNTRDVTQRVQASSGDTAAFFAGAGYCLGSLVGVTQMAEGITNTNFVTGEEFGSRIERASHFFGGLSELALTGAGVIKTAGWDIQLSRSVAAENVAGIAGSRSSGLALTSEAAIVRHLRDIGSPEALATAKLIKRGRVTLNLVDELPYLKDPMFGGEYAGWPSRDIYVLKRLVAEEQGGLAAHEVRHFLDKVPPGGSTQALELRAVRWQQAAGSDPTGGVDIASWLANHPHYGKLPKK